MKVLYLKIAELCLKVTLESRICRLPDNYTPFLIAESEVDELLSEIFVGDACLVFEDVAEELIAHYEDLGFVQEIYKSRSGGMFFKSMTLTVPLPRLCHRMPSSYVIKLQSLHVMSLRLSLG